MATTHQLGSLSTTHPTVLGFVKILTLLTEFALMRTSHSTSQLHMKITQHQKQTQQGFTLVQNLLDEHYKALQKLIMSQATPPQTGQQKEPLQLSPTNLHLQPGDALD